MNILYLPFYVFMCVIKVDLPVFVFILILISLKYVDHTELIFAPHPLLTSYLYVFTMHGPQQSTNYNGRLWYCFVFVPFCFIHTHTFYSPHILCSSYAIDFFSLFMQYVATQLHCHLKLIFSSVLQNQHFLFKSSIHSTKNVYHYFQNRRQFRKLLGIRQNITRKILFVGRNTGKHFKCLVLLILSGSIMSVIPLILQELKC